VETNESGETVITWLKQLHLFKEDAFAKAKEIGQHASVIQLYETETWNYKEMEAEEI
jgi:hypothetical protein